MKLIPRSVTVGAAIKSFGLMDGVSAGSDMSMTLDIPEGMSATELEAELVRVETFIQHRVLEVEAAKGIFPQHILTAVRTRILERLEKARAGTAKPEAVGN